MTTLLYFAAAIFSVAFCKDYLSAAAALAAGALWCAVTGRGLLRRLLALSAVCAVSAGANLLFVHRGRTALFYLGDNPCTLEALVCGLCLGAAVAGAVGASLLFSRAVTSDKLFYLLSFLSPKAALVLCSAFRYLPVLRRAFVQSSEMQLTAGLARDGRLARMTACFMSVSGFAMEKSAKTAQTLKALGWGRSRGRVFGYFRFRARDAAALFLTAALFAVSTACAVRGGLNSYSFYPELAPVFADSVFVAGLVSRSALYLLPAAAALF